MINSANFYIFTNILFTLIQKKGLKDAENQTYNAMMPVLSRNKGTFKIKLTVPLNAGMEVNFLFLGILFYTDLLVNHIEGKIVLCFPK